MGFWTHEHLLTVPATFVALLALSLVMRMLLIKKPHNVRMIPIKVIAVILVLIEIGKQIVSATRGYDLYHIPLHFCSIFLYVIPLFAFYRGKWQESVRALTASAMTALLIGMLIIPNVIYSGNRITEFFSDYLSFHTVFFHNLVIFALFLTVALDLHKPSGGKDELIFVTLFGTGFVAVAASASHVLNTNYSNFLHSTVSVVKTLTENIRLAIGDVPTKIIYTATLAILHVLLLIVTYYIFMAICIFKEKAHHAIRMRMEKK